MCLRYANSNSDVFYFYQYYTVFFSVSVYIKQYNVSRCAHNGTIYFKTMDIPLCAMWLF